MTQISIFCELGIGYYLANAHLTGFGVALPLTEITATNQHKIYIMFLQIGFTKVKIYSLSLKRLVAIRQEFKL
jgi:hypothetical protein